MAGDRFPGNDHYQSNPESVTDRASFTVTQPKASVIFADTAGKSSFSLGPTMKNGNLLLVNPGILKKPNPVMAQAKKRDKQVIS